MAKRVSILELRVINILEHHKFPDPVREFRFHPKRMWRFDFAWPDKKIALEIEGGVFIRGRHSTGIGFTADTEKYNQAIILGWKVLRYTIKNIYSIPIDLGMILLGRDFMSFECAEEIGVGQMVKFTDGKIRKCTGESSNAT